MQQPGRNITTISEQYRSNLKRRGDPSPTPSEHPADPLLPILGIEPYPLGRQRLVIDLHGHQSPIHPSLDGLECVRMGLWWASGGQRAGVSVLLRPCWRARGGVAWPATVKVIVVILKEAFLVMFCSPRSISARWAREFNRLSSLDLSWRPALRCGRGVESGRAGS